MEYPVIERKSPVAMPTAPEQVTRRGDWTVALRYGGEGAGPWLVDLSHGAKWDFQSAALETLTPWGMAIPEKPGQCRFAGGMVCSRLNRTQAIAWHIAGAPPPAPGGEAVTDVSDATVLLALVSVDPTGILEKVSAMDFQRPQRPWPFVLQGPVAHVPCRVVHLGPGAGGTNALLINCARGYARDMAHALLAAGDEFGLRPAGEQAWNGWVAAMEQSAAA